MLQAEEGSPSRRSSAEASSRRVRRSRAVSAVPDTSRSRTRDVTSSLHKLQRKYSLNDADTSAKYSVNAATSRDAASQDTSAGVFLVERERQRLEVEGCLLGFDRDSQRNWSGKDEGKSGNSSERNRDPQGSEKESHRNWNEKYAQRYWIEESQRDSCEGNPRSNWNEGNLQRIERVGQSTGRFPQESGSEPERIRKYSQGYERDCQSNWSEEVSQRSEQDAQRSGDDPQQNWFGEKNARRSWHEGSSNEGNKIHHKVTRDLENGDHVVSSRIGVTRSVETISHGAGSSRDSVGCGTNPTMDGERRLNNFVVNTHAIRDVVRRFDVRESCSSECGLNSYSSRNGDRRSSVNCTTSCNTTGNAETVQNSQGAGSMGSNNLIARDDCDRHKTWIEEGSKFDSLLIDNELNPQVTKFSENRKLINVNNVLESEPLTSSRFADSISNPHLDNNNIENEENLVLNGNVDSKIIGKNGLDDEETHRMLENSLSTSSNRSERSGTNDGETENVTPRHRPKSWYAKTTTAEEEQAKARRRKTHPGHHADYQEALSSLLWQPYECQRELTTVCSSPDDSDVAYWLGCRLPEFRIPREEQELRGVPGYEGGSSRLGYGSRDDDCTRVPGYRDDNGSLSSAGTTSSLSSSDGGGVSDREEWLERLPPVALVSPQPPVATGCLQGAVVSLAPDAGKNGSAMRSPVVDSLPPAVSGPVVSNINNLTTSNSNNNVSLVRCYAGSSGVSSVPSIDCVVASSSSNSTSTANPVRTFTSTEAQTDDVVVETSATVVRPRERRRHNRQRQPPQPPLPPPNSTSNPNLTDRLPDILNSHLPPPYTTLPPPHLGLPPPVPVPSSIPVLTAVPPPPPLPHTPATVTNLVAGLRFPFAIVPAGRRRSRQYASSEEPKSCCGVVVSQAASVRWLMLLVLLVGLCCAFVGTLLLVTRAAGRDHLTLALLIIGVGIVLVGVSAAAWRLTGAGDGSGAGGLSCRAMLGLGGPDEIGASEPNRRFVPRLPPSYGRPHHPYAAMMYPEFQYRAPPPSYQASMQEYRLRLLLLDRHSTPPTNSMSPPPTYRSQAGSLLRAPIVTNRRDLLHYQMAASQQSDYSRPPSYRSRTSCSRSNGPCEPGTHSLSSHSRDPSQLSMTSDAGAVTPPTVNVITVHHEESEPIIKLAPGDETALSPIAPKDDSNLVTIVQTSSQSTGPVIVTISGNSDDGQCSRDTEMEILAHL
ncbi:uncharacterized protein LOC111044538 isoform X2 [Nilaparvata lugens]|uniref:uncharacterized protein LOC111044538 isoform X2 n=1 Tax=Nilaparvata lugens TaxID=108931 RepID=UPI00193E9C4C|nr:uncharacterized protein LOC111044538 isoform X2 [Nilaparvata lugens]